MNTTYIEALFGISFILTVVATPIARWLGLRVGLIDSPDQYRKIHRNAIPLGGGIAVFFGFVIPIALAFQIDRIKDALPPEARDMIVILFVGGSMAMLMGLADDMRNLKARWKIIFQILSASLAYSGGFRVDAISSPFGTSIELGYASYLVTVMWFLLCMNALNLVDGLDGLSAGIGFIVSVTLLGVNLAADNTFGTLLNACLSGALLGFLIFNFNPASIFLGDSGSMFIGFLIAAISLLTKNKTETATALLIPLIALGVPIYDMALAIIRRWSARNPISVADRRHIHHRLLAHGFSQREAVTVLYGTSVVLCLAAVIVVYTRSQYSALILVLLALAMVLGTRVLRLVDITELRNRLRQDHEEHMWRKSVTLKVEKALQNGASSRTLDEMWDAITVAFESLELSEASCQINLKTTRKSWTWKAESVGDSAPQPVSHLDAFELSLMLTHDDIAAGKLTLKKTGRIQNIKNTTVFGNRIRDAFNRQLPLLEI